jgi:2-iminobutanoate/2-iminopropanoate deaminase
MEKQIISTEHAPKAIGPYSQGVRAGDFVFYSGQIALDDASGTIRGDSSAEQAEIIMGNIAALLEAAELDFNHVVKSTIYMTDLGDFAAVNSVYGRYFPQLPPARSTVEVKGLPRGALLEIEIIAYCG